MKKFLAGIILILALTLPVSIAFRVSSPTPILAAPIATLPGDARVALAPRALSKSVKLPLLANGNPDACSPILGEAYGALIVTPPPTDRPAEQDADLNLALRGYAEKNAFAGLVDYGAGDPKAPQLTGLVKHSPKPGTMYQVYDWNWTTNSRGGLITDWPVTLAGLIVTPGETIHAPNSGYGIGSGYMALVLYASEQRITLKYTNNDNVVSGYTIHVEGICVEPNLLALYNEWNSAGRSQLPALKAGQAFGRAWGSEIRVAIRDDGAFMDPRSKDWWLGF